jgi:hypothetical protein
MKKVFGFVKSYFLSLQPLTFFSCTVFIAVAIFCNYYYGLNARIYRLSDGLQLLAWFGVFATAFYTGYIIEYRGAGRKLFQNPILLFLLCTGPLLFAWKMVAHFHFSFTADAAENAYWNQVLYWPAKLVVMLIALFFIWQYCNPEQPFYGTKSKGFDVKPYLGMLALMLPLLLWAATQRDFLATYPKLKNSVFLMHMGQWYHVVLYELSYGSDFLSIELFFRGFLVLAFAKWVGKEAVLPMALFYCTIHFGKPLGECISSYFGGLILGAVTLHTRSIWGGLVVHLGIAWLMEVFGYFGHVWMK